MRIIFAGTPEFASTALEALHSAGFEIALVLTQPDRPAGRGLQCHPSAVKQFATAHGITVAQPTSLRLDGKFPEEAAAAHALMRSTPHDVIVVAAYGLILPMSVLDIPPLGCINIHASILPRWRGAAPIHRAIEAGDTCAGITIMQMDAGLDTGDMLQRASIPIASDDTTATLHDKLASLGGKMIVETLQSPAFARHTMTATPQPSDGVTYAAKILKEESALDFTLPADLLARRIRAFNPFPGATARFGNTSIKFWDAHPISGPAGKTNIEVGSIIVANAEQGILIACGELTNHSVLRVTQLQKPGGKRLMDRDFIQGFPLENGHFD
jgi:methionyl-tRNA formyltransferase